MNLIKQFWRMSNTGQTPIRDLIFGKEVLQTRIYDRFSGPLRSRRQRLHVEYQLRCIIHRRRRRVVNKQYYIVVTSTIPIWIGLSYEGGLTKPLATTNRFSFDISKSRVIGVDWRNWAEIGAYNWILSQEIARYTEKVGTWL